MAVKIKLKRLGKIRNPQYRIVVADARTKRDGRAIEEIGKYHPKEDPSFIEVNNERAQYWLKVGAQPTEAVVAIFKVSGDWQQFKGLPAPAPMKVAAPEGGQEGAVRGRRQGGRVRAEAGRHTPKKKAEQEGRGAQGRGPKAAVRPSGEHPAVCRSRPRPDPMRCSKRPSNTW